MGTWSRFSFSSRGNVAFVFAVSIVPLLFAVGAALDLIRANQAEDALQGAADAAALAAGASDRTTDADTVAIATNYVRKNFTARVIENIKAMTITNTPPQANSPFS
jgi:Flp pilus assembly protein TadG